MLSDFRGDGYTRGPEYSDVIDAVRDLEKKVCSLERRVNSLTQQVETLKKESENERPD